VDVVILPEAARHVQSVVRVSDEHGLFVSIFILAPKAQGAKVLLAFIPRTRRADATSRLMGLAALH
jgi:hypothetical protein